MPQNTTHVYQDFFALDEHERPAVSLTPLAYDELRRIPTLEELLQRKGSKGLQAAIDELSWIYQDKHGFDWMYQDAEVFTQNRLYFVRVPSGDIHFEVHYLGNNYRAALAYLMDYVSGGRANRASMRAR